MIPIELCNIFWCRKIPNQHQVKLFFFFLIFRKSVRLGEYNTETDIDCIFDGNSKECADPAVDLTIEKVIIHENYQPNLKSKRNDIALIRLAKNVTFSTYIQPISLPHDKIKSDLTIGAEHVIAGWGRTRMCSYNFGIWNNLISSNLIAFFSFCSLRDTWHRTLPDQIKTENSDCRF